MEKGGKLIKKKKKKIEEQRKNFKFPWLEGEQIKKDYNFFWPIQPKNKKRIRS